MLTYVLKMVWLIWLLLSGWGPAKLGLLKWYKYRRESLQSGHKQPLKISQLRTQKYAGKLLSKDSYLRTKWAKFAAIKLPGQLTSASLKQIYFYYIRSASALLTQGKRGDNEFPWPGSNTFSHDSTTIFILFCLRKFYGRCLQNKRSYVFLWSQLGLVQGPICSDQVFFWSAALVKSWHNSKKIRIELWVIFIIT